MSLNGGGVADKGKLKKPLILVVEDEKVVAIDITRTLRSLGYDISPPVASGEEALERLKKSRPDLILLDVRLEGDLDGIETAEIIRSEYQIPYIYLSTFSDEETLSRAKRTEPYGYITKSSHKNDLHSMIEMALYRHAMEERIKEKEELLSVTLKSISDAVIGSTLDGTIISWNSGAESIFGYTGDEVSGKNISILTPPFYPNEMPEILDTLQDGNDIDHYETIRQKKDGGIINVSVKVSPIRNHLNRIKGASIIARDVTARKRLEREVLEISEKERRRIGQDLHDSLGQKLTGISLQIKALENRLQEINPEEALIAASISRLINDTIMHTRTLAKNLLTVTLKTQGLSVALQELASYCEELYGISTRCSTALKNEINDSSLASQLYHIAQEAVTNATRHSGASSIEISIYDDDSEIILDIYDNGNGAILTRKSGIGLKIMEFRSSMIDGRLSFYGEQGKGSHVICRVPKIGRIEDQ
jgi:two-component system, LuxR family, sensor kinase FixL